jgi:hypothetical protein
VAVICSSNQRFDKIRPAVTGSLGPEPDAHVIFSQPDEFLARLQAIPPPAPQGPSVRRGYTPRSKMGA